MEKKSLVEIKKDMVESERKARELCKELDIRFIGDR
jgi:hypothetical protein